jgi:hypothetical protein
MHIYPRNMVCTSISYTTVNILYKVNNKYNNNNDNLLLVFWRTVIKVLHSFILSFPQNYTAQGNLPCCIVVSWPALYISIQNYKKRTLAQILHQLSPWNQNLCTVLKMPQCCLHYIQNYLCNTYILVYNTQNMAKVWNQEYLHNYWKSLVT